MLTGIQKRREAVCQRAIHNKRYFVVDKSIPYGDPGLRRRV